MAINLTNGYAIAVCNNIFSGGFAGTNGTFIWALIIVIVGIIYFDERRVRQLLAVYIIGFILLAIYQFFFQQNPTVEFAGDMGHYAVNILGIGFLVYSTFSIFIQDLIKELHRSNEEAQYNAKVKSDFLSQMSHEIRSPLNAVIGMVQIAQRNKDDPERVIKSLGTIDDYSKHLLRVINDILDYSKLDSHKLELDIETFSLAQNIDFLRSMLIPQAVKKGITLNVCKVDETAEYILADQLRLNQILINLLSNAVKFTASGGTVSLLIDVKSCKDGMVTYHFAVSDTGIGMTVDEVNALFMPFSQANNGVNRTHGGTGLGLAISQNLCQMMGGEIQINSTPGIGSTFYFELCFPIGEKKLVTAQQVETCSENNFEGKRILVVDDIDINREIVMALLENTGIIVEDADNGEKAVNLFVTNSAYYYDLILMDVQMPVMDGLSATKLIRSSEKTDAPQIPIIALTANVIREEVDAMQDIGMNAHIPKPIEHDVLVNCLKRFL